MEILSRFTKKIGKIDPSHYTGKAYNNAILSYLFEQKSRFALKDLRFNILLYVKQAGNIRYQKDTAVEFYQKKW